MAILSPTIAAIGARAGEPGPAERAPQVSGVVQGARPRQGAGRAQGGPRQGEGRRQVVATQEDHSRVDS